MIHALLKRPAIIFLVALILLGSGGFAIWALPVKLQPIVNEPNLVVNLTLNQDTDIASLERELSLPLENIAMQASIVKHVSVTTSTRNVRLNIEITDAANANEIEAFKKQLEDATDQSRLTFKSREIRQSSTGDQTFMQIAIIPEDFNDAAVRDEMRNSIIPKLQTIAGIRSVNHQLDEYKTEYILELPKEQLTGMQAVNQWLQTIRQSLNDPILGTLQENNRTDLVRSEPSVTDRDSLENLPLMNGMTVQDVFEVKERIPAEEDFFNAVDGQENYIISLRIANTADEIELSRSVREALSTIYENQASSWEVLFIWDSSEFIGQAIREVVTNILLGMIVAVLLLLLIFRSIKTTLIVGISIPISLCTALITMYFFDYSINLITLIGLGIGTGMIVDACIVVLENIFRKIEQGISRWDAIVEGTQEVIAPVTTSVLTTVIVFIPIGYLEGVVGAMARELALTVIVSLLASLVVSLTMIPIFSQTLIRPTPVSSLQSCIANQYANFLARCLRYKWVVIISFITALAASLFVLIAYVPKNYIPDVSERAYYVRYDVDATISLADNRRYMEDAAKAIKDIPGVRHVFYWGNANQASRGHFYIHYWPVQDMPESEEAVNERVNQLITERIPYTSARFSAGQSDTSDQIQLSITAGSMSEMLAQIPSIEEDIREIAGVSDVEWNRLQDAKEWSVALDANKLELANLSRNQVEQYISLMLSGATDYTFDVDGEERKLRILFPPQYTQQFSDFKALPLAENVTLAQIATFDEQTRESLRQRTDGEYESTMTVFVDKEMKEQILEELISGVMTPSQGNAVTLSLAGREREQGEAFDRLILAAVVAFLAIFVILTAQFHKFRQPLMIMLTLPFTLIGVCLGFILTGREFDILAMIGVIMLLGIVVNNSIILIDFVNKRQANHETSREAIIEAAKIRLRPILTTTFTTIGGLIPMLIGGSNTSDFQTPVATAVVFGLLFSLPVSLLLLPVVYDWIEGKGN